jgi:hypothetical protein
MAKGKGTTWPRYISVSGQFLLCEKLFRFLQKGTSFCYIYDNKSLKHAMLCGSLGHICHNNLILEIYFNSNTMCCTSTFLVYIYNWNVEVISFVAQFQSQL